MKNPRVFLWCTMVGLGMLGSLASAQQDVKDICSLAQDADRDKEAVLKLQSPDSSVRRSAAYLIWASWAKYDANGAAPKIAVPALLIALTDQDAGVRAEAAKALGAAGQAFTGLGRQAEPAVPGLTASLKDPSLEVRSQAAQALGYHAKYAISAVPALIASIEDASSGIQKEAAHTLGTMGAPALSAIPALTRLLYAPVFGVRDEAAFGLLAIDRNIAARAFQEAASYSDSEVRANAVRWLGSDRNPSEGIVPKLIAAIQDANSTVRMAAIDSLGYIGPNAIAAVPALIDAAMVGTQREHAAAALGRIGPLAHAALPTLLQMVRKKEPKVQVAAATAIWQIDADAVAVRALAAIVKDGDLADQLSAIQSLGEVGPRAVVAVPALVNKLKSMVLVDAAVETLRKIGPGASAAVPALLDMLIQSEDYAGGLSSRVAESVNAIGIRPQMVPRLIAALKNKGSGVRRAAISLLGKLGSRAKPATMALALLFQDPGNEWAEAGGALMKIGPAGGAAVPIIISILEDRRMPNYHRIYATWILRRMGRAALPAAPALKEALNDRILATYAKDALAEIQNPSARH